MLDATKHYAQTHCTAQQALWQSTVKFVQMNGPLVRNNTDQCAEQLFHPQPACSHLKEKKVDIFTININAIFTVKGFYVKIRMQMMYNEPRYVDGCNFDWSLHGCYLTDLQYYQSVSVFKGTSS